MMLITQEGKIIRLNVSGVRVIGRSTQGVKLMDLDEEDRLVAAAKLAERDEELPEGEEGEGGEGEGEGEGGEEVPPEPVN